MYTRKKNVKKRFTPIRGKRQKELKLKRFFLGIIALVLIMGLLFAFYKAAGMFFNAERRPDWLEWHIKKINITGENGYLAEEVKKYISYEEGDMLTHSDVVALEDFLAANLKDLKEVCIHRNFFNGNLNVKIKRHTPYARLKAPGKNYLIEEGGLVFGDDESAEYKELFSISLTEQIKGELLPKELVELIKALKTADALDLEEILVDMESSSFTLKLKNVQADMGGFRSGPDKIKYLKKVLSESEKRDFEKPFKIDFNYFKDGKIYLKPTK